MQTFIHSLAQRTNQETSTPYQTTPYMGCLKRKVAARPSTFRAFWYRGTRDGVFIGWRMEKTLTLYNYYHAKTLGYGVKPHIMAIACDWGEGWAIILR